MADVSLNYTIPEAKAVEYISDYVYAVPNNEVTEEGDPKYTDSQWVREHILRCIKVNVKKGKRMKYVDAGSIGEVDDIT